MNCPTCNEKFRVEGIGDGDLILCNQCAEVLEFYDGGIGKLREETVAKLVASGDYVTVQKNQAQLIDYIVKERTVH